MRRLIKRYFINGPRRTGLRLLESIQRIRFKRHLSLLPAKANEIVLISMARNEAIRLPYFFKYYRQLGVDRFVILDHLSTDETAEIVAREENADCIRVAGNFIYKRIWLQTVAEKVAGDRWCLVVDVDEFLVWPEMERLTLRNLIRLMETNGADAFRCRLLDMYPRGEIGAVKYSSGQDPLEVAPYFDGGDQARSRVFGVSPEMNKVPLLYFSSNVQLDRGNHNIQGAEFYGSSGALLHFKFLNDFPGKVRSNRLIDIFDQTYSRELSAYQEKTQSACPLTLFSNSSIRYEGPEQLVHLGMI